MNRRFANREEAGQELARRLASYQGRRDLLVLALPRGGVPVAAPETCQEFDQLDPRVQVICLLTPPDLQAIGLWYDDFSQVSDEEVLAILARARLSGDGPERRS